MNPLEQAALFLVIFFGLILAAYWRLAQYPALDTIRCEYCGMTREDVLNYGSPAVCCWSGTPTCPDCCSDELTFHEYDFGRDSETGYHDCGEYAHCLQCGRNNEARDAEFKAPLPVVTREECKC